ncbi:potassium-transporting ATPase subunit KdpC [Microbacterium protaetiae]|uniref:Potassium-transporting ATPase KdpC subunit n=1 Tax=Microbacterium protaetiae TaxID=2509458 RepID=A0A4V0YD66_9MICO|nr:potassium-transporting ATPase subunit KdpC [Microbacterium protaetiae]QAY59641.1 potassium-transporting ATPase subunit KdpC [Microbacterium protaetiae]
MSSALRAGRTLLAAVVIMIALTVVLGVVYPLVITGIGQLAFPWQANGSVLHDKQGAAVGSALLGQSFVDADGDPLPRYFQSRPSEAADGYAGTSSGGSNLGPESATLIAEIRQRTTQIATFNGVPESEVPADAVTASASGLDPDISPAYAQIQVARVARARGIPVAEVAALVRRYTQGLDAAPLGEGTVNVVELNLALDER